MLLLWLGLSPVSTRGRRLSPVRQYVLLGAGLDSFGYRSALAAGLAVFEVDHPRTQQWKRAALAGAGTSVPPGLTFVPADLGRESVTDALVGGGFDFSAPAVIAWLGVTMYLARPDIVRVAACLTECAPGSQLIADYMLPEEMRDAAGDAYLELIGPAAAEWGEPWRTFLRPDEMSELLARHGDFEIEHIRQRDLVPATLWKRSDTLSPIELSMTVRATVRQRRGLSTGPR
jgi:methyltransferase (TIGR00027 family)